ncbi:MAG: hypothetical protein AB4372_08460 [Xenococcus sp. (in: cyanobacteria)]
MKEQLEKRLAQLKAEFESGQKVMAELEGKQANLRDTFCLLYTSPSPRDTGRNLV